MEFHPSRTGFICDRPLHTYGYFTSDWWRTSASVPYQYHVVLHHGLNVPSLLLARLYHDCDVRLISSPTVHEGVTLVWTNFTCISDWFCVWGGKSSIMVSSSNDSTGCNHTANGILACSSNNNNGGNVLCILKSYLWVGLSEANKSELSWWSDVTCSQQWSQSCTCNKATEADLTKWASGKRQKGRFRSHGRSKSRKKWRGETRENRMFRFYGWGLDRNYFLNHSNLNSLVLSAGKFWALCCPDSLASHQCISTLRGLFRPASSDVVIKKPLLINSWTFTGFRGKKRANVGKIRAS